MGRERLDHLRPIPAAIRCIVLPERVNSLAARLVSRVERLRISPKECERTRSRGRLDNRAVEQVQQGATFGQWQRPEVFHQRCFARRELVQDAELEFTAAAHEAGASGFGGER
jgi:hypothetical protein